MPTIKNIIIFTIIGASFFLIYFFYIRESPDELLVSSLPASSPVAAAGSQSKTPESANSALAQDFLILLLSVKDIKLDDSILSDPAFESLDGSHSITLVPDGTEGRPNPFAPFGVSTPLPPPSAAPAGAPAAGAPVPPRAP